MRLNRGEFPTVGKEIMNDGVKETCPQPVCHPLGWYSRCSSRLDDYGISFDGQERYGLNHVGDVAIDILSAVYEYKRWVVDGKDV